LNNPQFRAQREHINALIAAMEARPYELVSIVARDGVRLTGRYYHQADGAPPPSNWRPSPTPSTVSAI
ncbi:MAG: hypothetical protein J6B99_06870, partial [Oscillospiraceae bacterium]|nr:hypothetical protein [Oscillospiraceae bacterium]